MKFYRQTDKCHMHQTKQSHHLLPPAAAAAAGKWICLNLTVLSVLCNVLHVITNDAGGLFNGNCCS